MIGLNQQRYEFKYPYHKQTPTRVVVSASEIIKTRFFVVDIAQVAEGLECAKGSCQDVGFGEGIAIESISLFFNPGPVAVNGGNDITLQSMDVPVARSVAVRFGRFALGA